MLAMSLSDIFKKDLEHRHDHHDSAFASRHEVWVLHGWLYVGLTPKNVLTLTAFPDTLPSILRVGRVEEPSAIHLLH